MPVIASNAPLLATHVHKNDAPIELHVLRYEWETLGATQVVRCREPRLSGRQHTTLADAAQRVHTTLYNCKTPYKDSYKVHVRAERPEDDPLLSRVAEADARDLHAMRQEVSFVGLRLVQPGPEERSGDPRGIDLPIGRLLPIVLDGTPLEQMRRMITGKTESGDFGPVSGKRKAPPDGGAEAGPPREKQKVKNRAMPGDIVFFVGGGVVPHVVLRVEQRPPRVAEESPKWLVVAPLPQNAGDAHLDLHASQFATMGRDNFTAAWAAALALEDRVEREARRGALANAIERRAALKGSKTPQELWAVMCPDIPCPPELGGASSAAT